MKRAGAALAGAPAAHSPVCLPLPARQRRRDSSSAASRHRRGPAEPRAAPPPRGGVKVAAGGRAYGGQPLPLLTGEGRSLPRLPSSSSPRRAPGQPRPPPQLLGAPTPPGSRLPREHLSRGRRGPLPASPAPQPPPPPPPHSLPRPDLPAAILPEGRGERAGAAQEIPAAAAAARMRRGGRSSTLTRPPPTPPPHSRGRRRAPAAGGGPGGGGAAVTAQPPPVGPTAACGAWAAAAARRAGGPFLAQRPGGWTAWVGPRLRLAAVESAGGERP